MKNAINFGFLFFFLILALPRVLPASEVPEPSGAIEGRVLIKGVREPVAYATIKLEPGERSEMSDEEGRFRFEGLAPGVYTIKVSEDTIDNLSQQATVKAGGKTRLNLYATRTAILLDEVVVSEEKEKGQMARQEIKKEELTGVPGANNDAIRVVESLPGVADVGPMGGEGLVIRGSSPEDSGYLFKGFSIPQLFHFGALISIINSELVEDISYYPGSYSVKYGGATGGIIEVQNRAPRKDRFGGVVDLATYSSFVLFEGPVGDKFSWAGAVRRSFIDFILPEVLPEDQLDFTLAPRFYDYTAIFDYQPNGTNTLEFVFLGSDDQVGLIAQPDQEDPFSADSFDFQYSWHRGDVHWRTLPTENLFNTLAVSFLYNQINFGFGRDLYFRLTDYSTSFRNDLSWTVGKWNELRFGLAGSVDDAQIAANLIQPPKEGQPGVSFSNEDTFELITDLTIWQAGGYVDDVMEPADWVQIVPGIRFDYNQDINDLTTDPRLLLKFFPTRQSAIKASAGVYHQPPEFDETGENFGTKKLHAEVAYQGSLGFEYDFSKGYFIDVQGYYKHLDELVSNTEAGDPEPYDNAGIGHVYGAELLARKQLTDRLFGWISYTYTESRRRDRPDSDWRWFDLDQRHNFIILTSYMFGENKQWRLGGKWQISTGLPYTDIEGAIYNADTDSYIPLYSDEINGEREEIYHQLDIRLDKLWIFNAWTLNTYLDVQNVYWQQYPFGYQYNFNYSERKTVSFPSFMPSIGVQARF